jgi:hypothetical protein
LRGGVAAGLGQGRGIAAVDRVVRRCERAPRDVAREESGGTSLARGEREGRGRGKGDERDR